MRIEDSPPLVLEGPLETRDQLIIPCRIVLRILSRSCSFASPEPSRIDGRGGGRGDLCLYWGWVLRLLIPCERLKGHAEFFLFRMVK
jgi:hypothetical protein